MGIIAVNQERRALSFTLGRLADGEEHRRYNQALYVLSRQVDNFTRNNSRQAPNTIAFLKELQEQLNKTLQGIRRFTQELRPSMLDDLGLLATLRWQVSDLEKQFG